MDNSGQNNQHKYYDKMSVLMQAGISFLHPGCCGYHRHMTYMLWSHITRLWWKKTKHSTAKTRAYVRICLDMSHGWRLNTARVRAGQGRQNSLDRNWHQRLQREHIAQHCETDSEIVESMFEIMQCLKMKYIVKFKLETVLIDNLTSPIQRNRLWRDRFLVFLSKLLPLLHCSASNRMKE